MEVFPVNDGDAFGRCCFSSVSNISVGVVTVFPMDISGIFEEVKQLRRRTFEAKLNRSVFRISSETDRNFAILIDKDRFQFSVCRIKRKLESNQRSTQISSNNRLSC